MGWKTKGETGTCSPSADYVRTDEPNTKHTMKLTSATYSHACIGFPVIVLKWYFDGQAHVKPYVTEFGVMKPWAWQYGQEAIHDADLSGELARFDDYVRARFANVPEAQG
jgi:hypothetical protein